MNFNFCHVRTQMNESFLWKLHDINSVKNEIANAMNNLFDPFGFIYLSSLTGFPQNILSSWYSYLEFRYLDI